jgi:hypothetical protein
VELLVEAGSGSGGASPGWAAAKILRDGRDGWSTGEKRVSGGGERGRWGRRRRERELTGGGFSGDSVGGQPAGVVL